MDLAVRTELEQRFPTVAMTPQPTRDGIPTMWVRSEDLETVLSYLKDEAPLPFRTLYDLTAIDERVRTHRADEPTSDFTVVYHLLSYERNEDVRIKVALIGERPHIPTVTGIWPSASWYERELWDMFGIEVDGHPNLIRILNPPWWDGHPLRKEHPSRATETGTFSMPPAEDARFQEALRFHPEQWGLSADGGSATETVYLNLGPQHPGTHGLLRAVLQLKDEQIVDVAVDIGYHHRAAEKMGERQTWHTFVPYTDRVDYLGGVMNNLAYVLAVEQLAGIEVPDRAKVIRVMMAELSRIASHLVWYGTFAQDLGQLSPVFFMFSDRERVFDIVEAVTGGRMHPSWFRVGGVTQDLPHGWDTLVGEFIPYLRKRLREYDQLVMASRILKARTVGVGEIDLADAIEWGVTGPNLRACNFEWDFRKKRPYSGYEQFSFDIPVAARGDSYGRAQVRVEEIRQSLRIVEQCLKNMPSGSYKSDHPLSSPPRKEQTMHDIETLIAHFLTVSWGPVVPAGEGFVGIEATKGNNGYYLISDGGTGAYRLRIRTPSFAHVQTLPLLCRGLEVADLIAILGSLDFVLSDVDR